MAAASSSTVGLPDVDPEEGHGYDYDLVVIGGGSGGLAASKQAASYGKKVAVLDFVRPSPPGTTWGLGGTCVNVGCIPKKLMHQATVLGESVHDAAQYGWQGLPEKPTHDWSAMVQAVQDHIGSLNFGYRTQLREKSVTYLNKYGTFVDPHTLEVVDKKGVASRISSRRFVIAVGGRPKYPDIPGAREHCITSDDLFSLPTAPGKTLVIGASYVALECAGFLGGLGYDATVMMRSIPLRGFDQQCAELIVDYMSEHGHVKFQRNCVPTAVEKLESGKLRVSWNRQMGEHVLSSGNDEYDTVLLAIGRDPETSRIKCADVGVQSSKSTGKILVNALEQTTVPHIYAIGDVTEGRPELTPVAIAAGRLLANRLYGGSAQPMDYDKIPTTVFTPLEYGAVGMPEERAVELFGEPNIEVFHSYFTPLEWTVPHRPENVCYAKLVCNSSDNMRVVGFHVLGPNAGEITQGYALGIRMGATKSDFDNLIGIHPTQAEEFTTLFNSKREGGDAKKAGC